jgi:small ligand-binding sensory domain FIST
LLGVELGIVQRGSIAIAFFGRFGSPELLLRRPRSGILDCEETERGGAFMQMSVRQRNSGEDSLLVFQMTRDPCEKWTPRVSARVRFACLGPARA